MININNLFHIIIRHRPDTPFNMWNLKELAKVSLRFLILCKQMKVKFGFPNKHPQDAQPLQSSDFEGLGVSPNKQKCLWYIQRHCLPVLSGIPDNSGYTESCIIPNLLENLDFIRIVLQRFGITFLYYTRVWLNISPVSIRFSV